MKNAKRNWKTTIFGILTLAGAGFSIYSNPSIAFDPQTLGAIAGGVGLILAKDGAVSGTAEVPAIVAQGKLDLGK